MASDKKKQQEQERIFNELLRDEANAHCADCGARGPKWASWNIGVFLCIRCGGIHRKLGTHISKVKSVTLDTWTPEQLESIKSKGNARANQLFNPGNIPMPRNPNDRDLENYIRDKYERKAFMNAIGRSSAESYMGTVGRGASSSGGTGGGASRWPNEMRQLREMGFTYEPYNIRALEQTKGDLQAAVDAVIAMGPPPAGAAQPSPSGSTPSRTIDSRSIMANAQLQITASSPFVKQLKGMGFNDEALNMAALQKANGDLDTAVMFLTDRRAELQREVSSGMYKQTPSFNADAYAQQFQQQNQQQQQQQKPASPPKPKNDLLDLLGDSGDPFATAQQPQPWGAQPAAAQMMMSGNTGAAFPGFGTQQGFGSPFGGQQPQQPFATGGSDGQKNLFQLSTMSAANPFGAPPAMSSSAAANPFGGAATAPSSSPFGGAGSPFGGTATAPAQPQQQAPFGAFESAASAQPQNKSADIMSLYNQPKPQPVFGMQMAPMASSQQQQQPAVGNPFGAATLPQSSPFGGAGMMQQPQQQSSPFNGGFSSQPQQQSSFGGMSSQPFGSSGMQGTATSTPFGGSNVFGGPATTTMPPSSSPFGGMSQQATGVPSPFQQAQQLHQQQQQQQSFGAAFGGMNASGLQAQGGNYSMVSTPFNQAQQPKMGGTPSGGFGMQQQQPQQQQQQQQQQPPQAQADPFAGLGGLSAFSTVSKPQSTGTAGNSNNPFF